MEEEWVGYAEQGRMWLTGGMGGGQRRRKESEAGEGGRIELEVEQVKGEFRESQGQFVLGVGTQMIADEKDGSFQSEHTK
ncbi:undecaprenyl-diphosphatase, partial [Burkholderia thailandensis]|nr:undecaprenyl-diphosphatase [Burkholderia thailandensis]